MTLPVPPDRVRAVTTVSVEPQRAFELFTDRVDQWWQRSPQFRFRPDARGTLAFEAGVGGRFFERYEDGSIFVIGRISAWEPGSRLVFTWRGINYAEHESTEVEILFEPIGSGTRVTVEHRGFQRLPAGHAALHGLSGRAFGELFGGWWGELLVSLRRRAMEG